MGSFSYGIQSARDAMQKFMTASLPVYLRVKNFDDTQVPALQLGFTISVTGGGGSGYTDTQIFPPPQVQNVSTHDIGMSGGKLMFGARTFDISNTWVAQQVAANGFSDPYQVFRASNVVGFFYDGRLFSIMDIKTTAVSGLVIFWKITANDSEAAVTA
ncbi:MAG: hypothetical protein KGL39_13575 [Patescibacteria group bacterium]|nr:hypothetical protein [Patescibacteria group bacterium]